MEDLQPTVLEESEAVGLPYEWEYRMGEKHPEKRYPVFVIAFVAGVFGYVVMRNPLAFLVGFGAVMLSTMELFLPMKFRIDEAEAHSSLGLSRSVIRWENVKRAWVIDGVVYLSPLTKPSRMDAFRGVRLRTSGNGEGLLVKIAALLTDHGCPLERKTDPGGTRRLD